MDEIIQMLEEIHLPFAYDHFAEGESPEPPFVCYLLPQSDNFAANFKGGNPMRNLKRALSLTLASVMLLGMMVTGAGAVESIGFTDADEIVNQEAAAVTSGLWHFRRLHRRKLRSRECGHPRRDGRYYLQAAQRLRRGPR